MSAHRVAIVLSILVLAAGAAGAQMVWIPFEGNPVLPPVEPGTWYAQGRWVQSMVLVDGTFHLFFLGASIYGYDDWALGHATSTDGINWEMDPANPVMTPAPEGDWQVVSIMSVAVIHDGSEFRMWYGGSDGSIRQGGYATSPDGTSWTRHPGNPVLGVGPDGSFNDISALPSAVVFRGGIYHMWYTAGGVRLWESIGYAFSEDGLSWIKHPTPVLERGTGWENWIVAYPDVQFDGTTFHMWYWGIQGGPTPTDFSIGYATSQDGIAWTKDPANPIDEFGDTPSAMAVVRNAALGRLEMLTTNEVPPPGIDFRVLRATAEFTVPMDRLLFVPAAALASGAEGSFFQTDVDVNSTAPGASMMPVSYRFLWLPRGEDNLTPTASGLFILDPGESMRHENILSSVFGAEPDAVGALAIDTDSPYLIGMSRTYNVPVGKLAGTFGQALPAIPLAEMQSTGESRRIIFLSQNDDIRANVGCVNGTDQPVSIDIELHDSAGVPLETKTMDLEAWSNDQINRVFRAYQPVNGYADVVSQTADAAFYCYGSILDNETSDPTTVLPQNPSEATLNFIPAAALAAGSEGSFFQTDVDLNNAGWGLTSYTFQWLPRGEDNSTPTTSEMFMLDVGQSVRYENVLSEVFGAEPDALGALSLSVDFGNLLVMSRTYNIPTAKAAGTFGQALPGIPLDEMQGTGQTRRIIFLSENDDIRANVGCVNATDQDISIDLDLFDSEGNHLRTRTIDLTPWSNDQINRVFRAYAPVDGYVDVSSDSDDAAFYCYGSVLDNSTSDPTTIPPQ